jgi:hypothetical protein
MNYDQKKWWESNFQFDFQPQILWKKGSNEVRLEHVTHYWKDIFKGYNKLLLHSKKQTLFEKNMNVQSFGTTIVPLESPGEKWHLDMIPAKRHKVYYREGSGASSESLQAVWSLYLRLFVLSSLHHFHSTYTNRPLFLVVQVDLILNYYLWVRLRPISKLQQALLPLKCCELASVPQLFFSSVVSF